MSESSKPSPGGLLMMEAMVRHLELKKVTNEQLDDMIEWAEALLALLNELKLNRGVR